MLMTVKMPVEAANAAAKDGTLNKTLKSILDELKPEAAYFTTTGGMRSALVIFDMADTSQMPAIAEPWFLAVKASIDVQPVMTAEDLMKAGPAIEAAAKKYG